MTDPQQLELSLSKALQRAPEPASYRRDAEVVAGVLRRFYGDEAASVARATLNVLEAP